MAEKSRSISRWTIQKMVAQLVLVGAVIGGMPYTKHFLERGDALGKPLEKGDINRNFSRGVNKRGKVEVAAAGRAIVT
jgi:hypothetical protein